MGILAANRYVHQRLGSSRSASSAGGPHNKVCFHWLAGRCNRYPCPYRHSELPSSLDGSAPTKSANHQKPRKTLVWRNPNTASNPEPTSKSGKAQCGSPASGGDARSQVDKVCNNFIPNPDPPSKLAMVPGGLRASSGGARPQVNKVCDNFIAGNCSFGERCKFLHSWFVGDTFSLLTSLQGHQKVISGIQLPSGSDKLYSGSHDQTIRVWDCHSGQCVAIGNVGAKVCCLINEGPWIFVGTPNAVKAWNTETSVDLHLDGPIGEVYALEVANDMLFAGVQDGRILAWKFSAGGNSFEPVASLTGHRLAVVSLVIGAGRLFSGSMDTTIRVWDLTTLQCIRTLGGHKEAVMSLLCWDKYLLSCSLDQTVKVWAATETGNIEVIYTHNEEHGVLSLFGMPDAQAKPVLFCACNNNSVLLYDLPSFNERGKIFTKEEVRTIQMGPGGLFFTGDATGELRVWKWIANEAASA